MSSAAHTIDSCRRGASHRPLPHLYRHPPPPRPPPPTRSSPLLPPPSLVLLRPLTRKHCCLLVNLPHHPSLASKSPTYPPSHTPPLSKPPLPSPPLLSSFLSPLPLLSPSTASSTASLLSSPLSSPTASLSTLPLSRHPRHSAECHTRYAQQTRVQARKGQQLQPRGTPPQPITRARVK